MNKGQQQLTDLTPGWRCLSWRWQKECCRWSDVCQPCHSITTIWRLYQSYDVVKHKEQGVQNTKSLQLSYRHLGCMVLAINGAYVEQIFNAKYVLHSFSPAIFLHYTAEVLKPFWNLSVMLLRCWNHFGILVLCCWNANVVKVLVLGICIPDLDFGMHSMLWSLELNEVSNCSHACRSLNWCFRNPSDFRNLHVNRTPQKVNRIQTMAKMFTRVFMQTSVN